MTRDLYEAAMCEFIDDYLDEHPDADWAEAVSAWNLTDADYTTDYIATRTDAAWQKQKDARREHI
jgi:hypothetical protein